MSKILGTKLDDRMFAQINAKESTVIVATVGDNGFPNTTPIHLIIAPDRTTLYLAVGKNHQGYKNILQNENIMICLNEKDDLNISIRCTAKSIKNPMDSNAVMTMVEAKIIDIKSDSTHSETTMGIRFKVRTKRGQEFMDAMFLEMDNYRR